MKAQLPSNATACYALAVSADGKVKCGLPYLHHILCTCVV